MRCVERIKALREDNDYKQSFVAHLIHVAQTTYSDYEMGKVRIPLDSVIALAKLYDVSLDYISGISDIKNKYPVK